VKKLVLLATTALVAMLILVPAAMAQEMEAEVKTEETMMEQTMMMEEDLPKSGGVAFGSVLLPAGALLLGGGVLAVAVLRRR
jgi:hypothetical protein